VHEGHEQGLDDIVQVLGEDQLVVIMLYTARVEQAPLHSAAERAEGVSLELDLGEGGREGGEGEGREGREKVEGGRERGREGGRGIDEREEEKGGREGEGSGGR